MPKIQKILLVEDDFYISDIYETTLVKAGFNVKKVADGEAALREVKTFRPDLVLLDIMIPGVDGLEVLKQLRSVQEYKDVHSLVVMVTNLAQSEMAEEARRLGADGYIIKANIKPSELVATIRSYDSLSG